MIEAPWGSRLLQSEQLLGSEQSQVLKDDKIPHLCFIRHHIMYFTVINYSVDLKREYRNMICPHVFVSEPWWRSPSCRSSSLWQQSTVAQQPASWRSTQGVRSGTQPACERFDSHPADGPGSCRPRPAPAAMTTALRLTCRRYQLSPQRLPPGLKVSNGSG